MDSETCEYLREIILECVSTCRERDIKFLYDSGGLHVLDLDDVEMIHIDEHDSIESIGKKMSVFDVVENENKEVH